MSASTSPYIIQFVATLPTALLSPLVVGLVLWWVTNQSEKKRIRADAIRDLMTYRGDFASSEFRRALNKVSVIFHDKEKIRMDVRHLYEIINDASSKAEQTKRTIVGLIYQLCQHNGFKGLTEYDIDQAFPEGKQTPQEEAENIIPSIPSNISESSPSS